MLQNILQSLNSVLFPSLCIHCGYKLKCAEIDICLHCKLQMPYVQHSPMNLEGRLYQILNQRIKLESAMALCYFQEGSITQSILHSIKYKGNKPLARRMGKEMAHLAKQNNRGLPDVLVPIPLHPKKKKIRGFNQSEEICIGMKEVLSIPVEPDLLMRKVHKESQTHLGRMLRWQNISAAYTNGNKIPAFQHVGIVDDMITTGSTIEACYLSLKAQNPNLKISVYSLGFEA
jgi:ComF family protein